ncbi:MAG: hypothetical protein AAGD43_35465 [Pseudomonadota bacterium]
METRCVAALGPLPDEREIDPSAWPSFLERLERYVAARVPQGRHNDVVGEILLKVMQHKEKVASTRDPFARMKRVIANSVTDHYR